MSHQIKTIGGGMQAVIVHDDMDEVERLGQVLSRRGFLVASCSEQSRAIRFVRQTTVDLLILKQYICGRFTTSVALAAEFHNPRAATILLSSRSRDRSVELFEHVPSLYAVMNSRPDAQFLASLSLQAVQNPNGSLLVLTPKSRIDRSDNKRVA